jgi:hypothetical protein
MTVHNGAGDFMRPGLRNLCLVIAFGILCFGGSFTCNDDDNKASTNTNPPPATPGGNTGGSTGGNNTGGNNNPGLPTDPGSGGVLPNSAQGRHRH